MRDFPPSIGKKKQQCCDSNHSFLPKSFTRCFRGELFMPRAKLTQFEMESPWLVLEVSQEGRPRVLVSEWSEKRLVFTDDNHWGASFEPGEFVWCVMTQGDVIFVEATAPDQTGLINFQRLAARHGLAYVRGISPGQGKA
jgi:hypothetical protein